MYGERYCARYEQHTYQILVARSYISNNTNRNIRDTSIKLNKNTTMLKIKDIQYEYLFNLIEVSRIFRFVLLLI